LYVGSAPYACYPETLARFRPDLSFYAELTEIDGPIDHVLPNVVDANWRDRRRLGTATVGGDHANVGHSVWLAAFRQHLACEILEAGFRDFDAHALYMTIPRSLTQHISRMVFDNRLDGIRYLSKYGFDAECWALFEGRATIQDSTESAISDTDPALRSAMETHGLRFSPDVRPI
jgi:hypothetical protein